MVGSIFWYLLLTPIYYDGSRWLSHMRFWFYLRIRLNNQGELLSNMKLFIKFLSLNYIINWFFVETRAVKNPKRPGPIRPSPPTWFRPDWISWWPDLPMEICTMITISGHVGLSYFLAQWIFWPTRPNLILMRSHGLGPKGPGSVFWQL